MQKYKKNRRCVKCGNDSIKDKHKSFFDGSNSTTEFIRRTCQNCGYWWNESTIDNNDNDNE